MPIAHTFAAVRRASIAPATESPVERIVHKSLRFFIVPCCYSRVGAPENVANVAGGIYRQTPGFQFPRASRKASDRGYSSIGMPARLSM